MRFLKNQKLFIDQIEADQVLADFECEMKNGLEGMKSSLAMIPTYISADKKLPIGKKNLGFDKCLIFVYERTINSDEVTKNDAKHYSWLITYGL